MKRYATYIGENEFSMPIAKDEQGKYYCDVNMGDLTPDWHTMTANNMDGEPIQSVSDFNIELIVENMPTRNRYVSQYGQLDRLLGDIKYCINMGGNSSCWTNSSNPEEGFEEMRKLWNIFPEDAKPEWCTMQTIDAAEYIILHTDLIGLWHKWRGDNKSIACKLVLQLMDTDFFECNYGKALDFVLQLYPYIPREEVENEIKNTYNIQKKPTT